MKVAVYARVSTDDKDQNPETQLRHLRKYCETFGYQIVDEFIDEGKSARTTKGRTGYLKMMDGVDAKRYDGVVGYKLDRFHRSVANAILFVNHLKMAECALILTSQHIDTSTAMGMAMMQITAVFAELESANTAERVKIGMERAEAEGKICHRPKSEISKYQLEKARAILEKNPQISQRKLAEQFQGISRATLIRELKKEGLIQ